jgi:hypothetical protein
MQKNHLNKFFTICILAVKTPTITKFKAIEAH